MTDKQKEQREKAYSRSCGVCFICGKPLQQSFAQYSHRIPNKEMYRKKYGSWVIDHTKNGEYACSTEHNYQIDCGSSYGNHLEVIADILIYEYQKMWGVSGLDKLSDKLLEKYRGLGIGTEKK
jgi:DNA-directed RNA polymerase subunit N (RpoN/RPB10)